jgi:hypothetical protein
MILGIRTSPTTVRYAVLNCNGVTGSLVNAESENKLDFPADCRRVEQKLHWLHQELSRVLRQYPVIEKVVIESNEYGRGGEKASAREAAYLDAIILLTAGSLQLPVEMTLYRTIGTRRNEIKTFAETNVGKTNRYWNEQMADAVSAAWSGRND